MRNLEDRINKQRIRQQTMCSRPSQTNRFSVSTNDLKFTNKIRNGFKSVEKNMNINIENEWVRNRAEEKHFRRLEEIRGDKSSVKNDLYRFFSLKGESYVKGGGWIKGGRDIVGYYESKEYR